MSRVYAVITPVFFDTDCSLPGINSVEMPLSVRARAWERLGADLKPRHLDIIAQRIIEFGELPDAFDDYVNGKITGRNMVRIGGD